MKILLERANSSCTRNGVGCELLLRLYLHDAAWHSFTEPEQRIIAKTARAFRKELRREGFLPEEL